MDFLKGIRRHLKEERPDLNVLSHDASDWEQISSATETSVTETTTKSSRKENCKCDNHPLK